MGSIAYALAAGNAVVFKPSELTPGVGAWLVDAFAEVVPEQPVLQLVTGEARPARRSAVPGWTRSRSPARPHGPEGHGDCAETLTPVLDRVRRQGRDDRRRRRRPRRRCGRPRPGAGSATRARPASASSGLRRRPRARRVPGRLVERVARCGRAATTAPRTARSPCRAGRRDPRAREGVPSRGARARGRRAESVRPPYVDPVVLVDVPEDTPAMAERRSGRSRRGAGPRRRRGRRPGERPGSGWARGVRAGRRGAARSRGGCAPG